MDLDSYLARIGFEGEPVPGRDTLERLLHAHVLSVPFENLDVQLGVPTTTDVRAAYSKIVERGRGGWCYEQNGLFGWALGEIGFDVTRVAAAVMRHVRGEIADASHLCLLVETPDAGTMLADVGFGGSLIAPLSLAQGMQRQHPFSVGLRRIEGGRWRFVQDAGGGEFSFDFAAEAASESALAAKCADLQTSPDSVFVQNLVAQRRHPGAHVTLRGRVLTKLGAAGPKERRLESAAELVDTLAREFALDVPGVGDLWPRVVARHEVLFGST